MGDDMGDELARIEFLDPQQDADDIAWLDSDGAEETGGTEHVWSHEGSVLPPRTTARRVLGSLLVFALALSATGYAGRHAYRHDQAVAAAANVLLLDQVNVGDPVTLTDPGALGGVGAWQIEPSSAIAVDVTNESPDPITLLPGATLSGGGLVAPATLRPSGTALLKPGESGRLVGMVTVNCSVDQQFSFALDANGMAVRARTASGAVGVAVLPLNPGGETLRQQICNAQGQGLATIFFPESADPRTHSFTLTVAMQSLVAHALPYQVEQSYSNSPPANDAQAAEMGLQPPTSEAPPANGTAASVLPGIRLSASTPAGPVSGSLASGASVNAGYTVHVLDCPSKVPTAPAVLNLEVLLKDHGTSVLFQTDSFDLNLLVGSACGLLS